MIAAYAEQLDRASALIFDMDGTLIDSMPAHFQAWSQVADEFGLTLTRERFYKLGGVPTYETLQILSRESGVSIDLNKAKRRKELLYSQQLDQVQEITLIADIARHYHRKKPLAVATGAGRLNAERMLNRLNLAPLFDVVMTADDVTRHKPSPDVFARAAQELGVPARECVAFEDTDIGLEAIHAAEMTAVDVRPLLAAKPV